MDGQILEEYINTGPDDEYSDMGSKNLKDWVGAIESKISELDGSVNRLRSIYENNHFLDETIEVFT